MARFDDQLPDDVRDIAERLSASRATFTPLELDELRQRVQQRAQRAPGRRGLAGRMHARWVAVLLAAGLLLTSGAGVVIACESVGGGGSQTFGTTSFHHARDASWCQYHGPYTRVIHIDTRHGVITVTIVWDCRHMHVHFDYGFPFNWRFGDGDWNHGSDGDAPDGTSYVTVSADGSTYTVPCGDGWSGAGWTGSSGSSGSSDSSGGGSNQGGSNSGSTSPNVSASGNSATNPTPAASSSAPSIAEQYQNALAACRKLTSGQKRKACIANATSLYRQQELAAAIARCHTLDGKHTRKACIAAAHRKY